ncbi:hypothetical protein DRF59_17125 [Chryseobacterium flavum]|uniref:Uncharacterized protein n=1 Tax=Chryseobacterium flavum TaxID=415851 RepID=A0A3D9CHH8_9FLAO|nr:hypothetical protein [Chryseobacterium flavum]REC65175.1 hypothetical protein DRF59_17125 [Chryseobacterium flavum]
MNIIDWINEHNGNFAQLKKLIISMNLMPGLSKSSFDHLTEKLLQQLEKGADQDKLEKVIETELCVSYGLYKSEFDAEELASEIFNWWENNNN